MTSARATTGIDPVRLVRGWVIALAAIAILLGVIGLLFPGASLLTVAILFGLYLVASGLHRVIVAIFERRFPPLLRVLTGILGVLLVAAGVIAFANPFASLQTLGIFIGLGWIVEGAAGFVAAGATRRSTRTFAAISAAVSVVAGVAMLILPVFGLSALLVVGSILLIVLGVVALAELPRRTSVAA